MTRKDDKLRGGYYTPSATASFIANWAIRSDTDTVLEPSCGDGAILRAAVARLVSLGCPAEVIAEQILGIELMPDEAAKAEETGASIACGDFFSLCEQESIAAEYNAIIGNPPFIRYQDFKEEFRGCAFSLMRKYGFSPNRLTNIWVPFLVIGAHHLSSSGRLAMVIPAELFQVNYARETREFLLNYFESITLITFKELLFEGAQQEVVLLLAEKKPSTLASGIRVIEAVNESTLHDFATLDSINSLPKNKPLPPAMKWQSYYLEPETISLIERLLASTPIKTIADIAEVNVGLVSGQNSFFVINEPTAKQWGIGNSCKPIVSRSLQLEGLSYTKIDMETQRRLGKKVLLFSPKSPLNPSDKRYVNEGERLGHNTNYKCRIRKPWYKVPESWQPDAFFYRQVGSYPRIVLNETESINTDTLHKVRFKEGINPLLATLCFNNSLTFAMSELMGRSYGGGVLTFEPSEARSLPIPYLATLNLDFGNADKLARSGKVNALLDYVDNEVLIGQMGLTKAEIGCLRNAWEKLRDKRLARRGK